MEKKVFFSELIECRSTQLFPRNFHKLSKSKKILADKILKKLFFGKFAKSGPKKNE
jgi:hypothetical protein